MQVRAPGEISGLGFPWRATDRPHAALQSVSSPVQTHESEALGHVHQQEAGEVCTGHPAQSVSFMRVSPHHLGGDNGPQLHTMQWPGVFDMGLEHSDTVVEDQDSGDLLLLLNAEMPASLEK